MTGSAPASRAGRRASRSWRRWLHPTTSRRRRTCAAEPTPRGRPRYDRGVIWEPFVLALVLGLIVSAGLYFAYLWPAIEPLEEEGAPAEPAAAAVAAAEHEPAAE